VTLERPVAGVGCRTRLLDSTGHYLPFALRVVDRRAYVLADLSDAGGPRRGARGAELVAFDALPVGALLGTMQRYLSADGRNTSYRRYQLGTYWRLPTACSRRRGR
jgi:hypothetical protein